MTASLAKMNIQHAWLPSGYLAASILTKVAIQSVGQLIAEKTELRLSALADAVRLTLKTRDAFTLPCLKPVEI